MMPSGPFRVHMLSVLAISPAFFCDSWGKWSHVLLIKSGVVGPFLNSLWVNHGLVYSWLNVWMSKAFAGRKLQLMLFFECRPTFFDFYNATVSTCGPSCDEQSRCSRSQNVPFVSSFPEQQWGRQELLKTEKMERFWSIRLYIVG